MIVAIFDNRSNIVSAGAVQNSSNFQHFPQLIFQIRLQVGINFKEFIQANADLTRPQIIELGNCLG
jgi:hypothetical protein